MKKPLTTKQFRDIYSLVTRLTVEVIVKKEDGVILTKRSINPYKGFWHIPGGTVIYGDTVYETVRRVAQEELGIGVSIKKLLGIIHYPEEHRYRGFGWTVGVAFLTNIKSGRPRGSYQGEEVRVFEKLPKKIIKEQRDFIISKGLAK